MDKGQIKFIWTSFKPTEEQYMNHEFLQAEIRNFYWITWEQSNNDYDFAAKLQSMHEKLRSTLHVIK